MTSIKQASASTPVSSATASPQTAPQAPPTASNSLPNFCNLGIMVRLLIVVNVLVMLAALARAASLSATFSEFLAISIIAQPAMLVSLVITCGLSRITKGKLTYWRGVWVIFALEAALGAGFWFVYQSLTQILGNVAVLSPLQYAVFFVVATAVVLFYFDLRARSLSPALVEARLQALQARIRPHFLFNSINAVLSLIRAEPKRAERMLEDMSELFRVLMADNRRLRPLEDELELCRQYLNIEHIRLGERLKVVWNIESMPGHALVPPLILQPLIENAVYHGIEPSEGIGELTIDIATRGKQVVIRMTNPFQPGSTHVSGNRMAIANIKERLQLHFDAEAQLKAETAQNRYIVTINMPIQDQQS